MLNISQEAELLRKVPMFSKMESSKLKLLAFTSESLTFETGESLCHAGDPADCAYVIMSGEVEIVGETAILAPRAVSQPKSPIAIPASSPNQ